MYEMVLTLSMMTGPASIELPRSSCGGAQMALVRVPVERSRLALVRVAKPQATGCAGATVQAAKPAAMLPPPKAVAPPPVAVKTTETTKTKVTMEVPLPMTPTYVNGPRPLLAPVRLFGRVGLMSTCPNCPK